MELLRPASPFRLDYDRARPFPHIVIDGLFPEEILNGVLSDFPEPDEIDWRVYDSPTEKKLGLRVGSELGASAAGFLSYLNSPPMLCWLEELTGIKGLIPDPYYLGGGLHQIQRGGFLKIHADFNWHEQMKVHRRINLLVYLNKGWQDGWGGHLELWDGNRETGGCQEKILPLFGRCVVFNTTDFAYHGHPDPLNCPEGITRKSLALYYYTATRPADELTPEHGTLFLKRRVGEWSEPKGTLIRKAVRGLLPPYAFAMLKALAERAKGKPKRRLEDF